MKDLKYAHARDLCGMYVQKSRIAVAKADFNKNETLFTNKLDLNLSKKKKKKQIVTFRVILLW